MGPPQGRDPRHARGLFGTPHGTVARQMSRIEGRHRAAWFENGRFTANAQARLGHAFGVPSRSTVDRPATASKPTFDTSS